MRKQSANLAPRWMVATIFSLSLVPAAAQQAVSASGDAAVAVPSAARESAPEGRLPEVANVDFKFVDSQVVFPARPGVTIIDTRESDRGFDMGHIPGAISIPADRFDRFVDRLPLNRRNLLIFYCQDEQRDSSRLAAQKAIARGYTNVRVYGGGFADWLKHGGQPAVSELYVEWLQMGNIPFMLIDARPARTAAKGMLPGAINIPETEFDKHVDKLPQDKSALIIYYCGGVDCPHSANAARKARALGYTNVKTYPEGYPQWQHSHAAGTSSPGATR